MNFNFGEVLSRAWQIIWKHKVLWIFGILAGCSRGSGRFNSSNSGSGGGNGGFGQLPPELMRVFQWIEANMTAFIVGVCIFALLVWVITIFLSTIGRIGLIRGTSQAEGGAEKLVFGQLFSESMPYFWRMFGLSLLIALPILAVFAVFISAIIAFAMSAEGGSDIGRVGVFGMIPLLVGCVCLLIPVMFVVGMITRQAENAIILEDLPVLAALSRGWNVFRANLGPIILMAIILAVIGLAVSFVVSIPIFIIVIPSVIAFAAGNGQNWRPLLIMAIGLCLYTPILWLLTGIMTAYVESAWTLTYMRLTKPQDNAAVVVEANA